MRLQSETKVTVRDMVIGGPDPVICLPLVAGGKIELLRQAEELRRFEPDLVEWRIERCPWRRGGIQGAGHKLFFSQGIGAAAGRRYA